MSSSNIALIQNIYAAFGRGDIAAIVAALAPNVVWTVNGPNSVYPGFGTWKSPAQVQTFFKVVAENENFSDFTPKEFIAADDRVFVLGHYAGTINKTGKAFASDWIHVFTIRAGKIENFREFSDTFAFVTAYRG